MNDARGHADWLFSPKSCSSVGSSSSSDEGTGSRAGSWAAREAFREEEHEDSVRPGARKLAWLVVGLSGLALCLGLPQVPVLLHFHAPQGFEPGAGSLSVLALDELRERFRSFAQGMSSPVVLMVRAREATVLTGAVANFTTRISEATKTDSRVSPLKPVVVGYYVGADLGIHVPKMFLQAAFVSRNRRSTLLVFVPTRAPKMAVFQHEGFNKTVYAPWLYRKMFMEFLEEFLAERPEGTEVFLCGNPVIAYERVFDHSLEHLTRAEIFVLPLAMIIFIWLVGDLRLLIFPPILLLVSGALASALAVCVARRSPLAPDVAPAMVSVMMACSLDYSLFLLSRFNENRLKGSTLQHNVDVLLQRTGRTISVSGLLVAIAFFGAALVPERNLRTAGLVLGMSTLACVVVNVTLLPSLLLLASPKLDAVRLGGWLRRGDCSRQQPDEEALSPEQTQPHIRGGSGWLLLMRYVERRPVLAVAVVFVLFLPVTVQLPKLRTSADSYAVLPRDLPSVAALRKVAEDFPVGRFDPYAILLTADAADRNSTDVNEGSPPVSFGNSLLTREGFAAMLQLCDALKQTGGVDSILGPPMIMTQRVDWPKALAWHSPNASASIHKLYMSVLQTHVNGSAVLLQVHTSFLPRGPGAADWVLRVRRVLAAWMQVHPGFSASLSGGATLAADARATAMGAMPLYLGASTAAIMAVVLALYRSLLLPLRLAFAVAFTLAATFGVGIIVYQTPLLHGIWPWLADYDGITYEVVPLASGVAVALGLDYDIFLVSRIVEYRTQGLSDRASIIKGVASTGGIISGAGTIMALAFSGLFFAEKLLLQQLALLLVTSVLLDTFVVRTVLVPALMLSAQDLNWWPRRMPEPVSEDEIELLHSSDDEEELTSELTYNKGELESE